MEELKDKGIQRKDIFKKLVGFRADGAAVNQGKKQSVKTLLLEKCPWIFVGWCFGHKLELSIADAFKNTQFDVIDEILLSVLMGGSHAM